MGGTGWYLFVRNNCEDFKTEERLKERLKIERERETYIEH